MEELGWWLVKMDSRFMLWILAFVFGLLAVALGRYIDGEILNESLLPF